MTASLRRLLLVHWNATEAAERASRLRRAGWGVTIHWETTAVIQLRAVRDTPPDVVVIDLERLPSHGEAVGVWFRQQKATRYVPLVFVNGDSAKVARVRKRLPDANYTTWSHIRSTLRRATTRPPRQPVVPDTMSAYAGRTLVQKLGIKPNVHVALLGAPQDFENTLGALPEGVELLRETRRTASLMLLFVSSQASLERRLPGAIRRIEEGGSLWIAWPKKASQVHTDLSESIVRRTGLNAGLVDFKICAIDATWSGLRFARRGRRSE